MPRCKECKEKFEPKAFLQKFCKGSDECLAAEALYNLEQIKKKKVKDWKVKKKTIKEKLKTNSDHAQELQVIFNRFIRERDKNLNCISCGNPAKKKNAGHYRSVGGNPELRFNELNNNLQCEYCNTYLHGNLIDYRINLIKKIGLEQVEFLEGNHPPNKYSIPELIELIDEPDEEAQ